MMEAAEVKAWVDEVAARGGYIAIDEDGLALVEVPSGYVPTDVEPDF